MRGLEPSTSQEHVDSFIELYMQAHTCIVEGASGGCVVLSGHTLAIPPRQTTCWLHKWLWWMFQSRAWIAVCILFCLPHSWRAFTSLRSGIAVSCPPATQFPFNLITGKRFSHFLISHDCQVILSEEQEFSFLEGSLLMEFRAQWYWYWLSHKFFPRKCLVPTAWFHGPQPYSNIYLCA